MTYVLNGVGQLQGAFSTEDQPTSAWIDATRANKSAVFVDIDGTLVWGGICQQPKYSMANQQMTFTANDFCQYVSQRLQAKNYATNWSTQAKAAGTAQMAYTIISDAISEAPVLPISVSTPAAIPSEYAITFAAPLSQRQSVGSLLSQLQEMGYLIGFDYACDVSYVGGTPTATITLSYPRRGRLAGQTDLVFDVAQADEFTWEEDGTLQAMRIAEMGSGTGGSTTIVTYEPAISQDGYPILEGTSNKTAFSPAALPAAVLAAWGQNDLALYAYPPVTPTLTVPAFGTPTLGDWIIGDDIELVIGTDEGGLPNVPRFPNGLDVYMRIVQASVTIAQEGKSTVDFTLNMPPTNTPQLPPQ